ncbi:SMP-30/gluconolactonase/LRE family protein [Auraticoccus cholistanensis]|uniref:SMP-30/gluconolactonase/LRE family protein n=1 Tax=Auraticoccus cholistanensis TaxID=2656650 RepID=UPI0012E934CC
MTDDVHPLPAGLLRGEPRPVARNGRWFEGPAWLEDHSLVWSDVIGNRLLRRRPDAGTVTEDVGYGPGVVVEMEPSHHQNGHTVDREGRLLAASHGLRAVVRREADGSWTPLAERWQGGRFNSPNDLVVARDGSTWFTDPRYGLEKPEEGYGGEAELDGCYVYRVTPDGDVQRVSPAMPGPNGLAFSPDESVLHVVDSVDGVLWSYQVVDGSLGARWQQATGQQPDGIRVDTEGRIWSSAGDGVRVWEPGGPDRPATLLGLLPLPERTSNLAFGGPDGSTLAVTGGSRVWLVETGVREAR